ncbi:MAG: hypothetical protein A3I24_04470 [Candidatus Harrisonbacteria bacterium RIFCSPLOWO2_02_FULL_41_13b]|uniref:FAD dependent oxidoreductase domain-containing protein n=1 Tax=Candidatus Harrisonbacteria bacterium RIFCSPLOWO2_02_FULL_41_13b TaxID=1798409 RepID=A0A1G1ZRJ0_9BACT|nr:MAG: hypothetical protein A3I24_04470 [Candidatus Harrisonbacteria bacterium RIFCSPLOWO2_02_FULL_41_13b]
MILLNKGVAKKKLTMKYDIVIIGAGVVGCAIARELSLRYPDKKIVVLEKLSNSGMETSQFNSGVLHTGLHQKPGSLKARLSFRGNQLAVKYCQSKKLPILHTGMMVVISLEAIRSGLYKEVWSLFELIKRGRAQGIKFKFLSPIGIRALEPNIRGLGGIFIPAVWVINPLIFTRQLWADAKKNGAQFFFDNPVNNIELISGGYRIQTLNMGVETKMIINAAGLYADKISRLAGYYGYEIYPWRGEYYKIIGKPAGFMKRLIYPAIPASSPGKGIHFSPRVNGDLFIGPNTRPVPSKNYYTENKTPKEDFLKAVQKFCPSLKPENLEWAYSGIRAKITNNPGEHDFIIQMDRKSPPLINLIGIESPGLSSSMAIAEYVADLIK